MGETVVKESENRALAEVFQRLGTVEVLDIGQTADRKVLVAARPNGSTGGRDLVSLKALRDEYLAAPERRRGTAKFTTLDSFIEHAKRTMDADSVLFAIDAQKAGGAEEEAPGGRDAVSTDAFSLLGFLSGVAVTTWIFWSTPARGQLPQLIGGVVLGILLAELPELVWKAWLWWRRRR